MLLSLDEEIFFQYYWQAYPRNIRLFSGQHPAPLFHLLRSNGYEINTLYYNGYLGKRKGAYIDNYVTIEKTTICDTLSPKIRSFSFWGYCWLTGRTINHDHLIANAHQRLIESIINIDSTQPQFVLAHIQLPNHTTRSFRHNKVQDIAKFSALYRQASDHAARYLKQIIEHLQHDDPTAILFVFGDHGPHLSRGMQIADDPTFFLQDRYGILGGIYPRTTCTGYFDETLKQGYMTILDAVHTLLRCLSGGKDVLNAPRKYKHVSPQHPEYAYKDFLYE